MIRANFKATPAQAKNQKPGFKTCAYFKPKEVATYGVRFSDAFSSGDGYDPDSDP